MSEIEFIGKLQMVYIGDKNAFDEIVEVFKIQQEDKKILNDLLTCRDKDLSDLIKKNKELENINEKLSSALTSAEDKLDKINEYIKKYEGLGIGEFAKKDIQKIIKGGKEK